jgi:ubiquinone/menaquinone biosynthesis C-methylase UbiE
VGTIDSMSPDIAPIGRPRSAARASYDRIAPVYDLLEGAFEGPARERGLRALAAADGERVLEIGFGTGHALARLAGAVGASGHVVGIDISPRMRDVAERRLARAGLSGRVDLIVADALERDLAGPYDAAFMSFALELFEEPDMLTLLGAVRDALRPGGRVVVVAMATPEGRPGPVSRLYSWSHRRMPAVVDCRPIPVAELLERGGLAVRGVLRGSLFGIPYAVAGAVRE